MTYGRRIGWALCFAGLTLFFLSIIAWGTCTTPWHSPSGDGPHGSYSWTNGPGGRTAYDNDRASTTVNGEEHEYDAYGFTGDIPLTATITGFEVRIRGYSVGGGSVSVALSPDGGSTIDMQSGTLPWIITLPGGSSNEGWNSVELDNPPFIHTFTPAEVCTNDFTVWVKANVSGTAIYVDAVEVRVVYYDEISFPWNPNNPTSVSSPTHNAGVWYNASSPEGTTITLQWNSATDQPTCDSGIDGYRIYWDTSSSTNLGASDGYFVDEDGAHTQDFALANGQRWFHIRSVDNVGHLADTTAHYGPYQYDDTWPTNPNVTSSRATGTWLNSADVPISISGASDTPSGVDGFQTVWDHSGLWTHTSTKNREETWTGETFTLPNDGVWYFHLATVDNAGNWVNTSVYETEGWFGVDTHEPTDPTVTSLTHAEGSVSSDPNVQIAVSGATDPQYGESGYENSSGVDGFSVAWDGTAVSPPDAVIDHQQDWTGTTYALADGTWYFHLRTKDNAGNWTSTEDYGPVTIDTAPPNAPTITGIADDNGSSSSDEITNDSTLIISGTAEANSTVEVFRDGGSIGTTPANGAGNWTFDYTGTSLSDGSYSFIATATDAAGNTSAESSALDVLIDTQAPPTPGGRAPVDGTYTNDNTPTFSWSEPTDPGDSGVRDYHIIAYDSTHAQVKAAYPSNTQYTPTSLSDDAYTWKLATRDVAGNTGAWGNEWTLVVDTLNPTCTVSVGTATIYDGDLVQEVTVDYSEEMAHTANAPMIEFTGTTGTWSSNGNGSWNANHDQWTESFTITDAGEDVTATVTASGSEDLAGNTQVSNQTAFAVDTLNPTCTVSVGTATIYDGDLVQEVAIDYSEEMTHVANAPTIEFTGTTGTWSSNGNGAWDANFDQWTQWFTITDAGEDVTATVTASGAEDLAGNKQVSNQTTFAVDTENPTITSITSTTPDGYYASGSINVTVSFSEPVTLSGGTLDVTLDTPSDVISLAAFGPSTSSFTTYTVGAGDNSCDLDAIGVVLNGGTLRDNVGNDAVVSLPGTTIADGSDIGVDTTDPVISGLDLPDTEQSVNENCTITILYSAAITDNCCVNASDVVVVVEFITGAGTAVLNAPPATIVNNGVDQVNVSGNFTVSDLTAGDVEIRVCINGADCAGNAAVEVSDMVTIGDNTDPVITGLDLPDTDQSVNEACTITIPYTATLTDNCCIDADNVSVAVEWVDPFNTAVLTVPPAVIVNSGGGIPNDTVSVSGSFTVSNLTGCPVHVRVRVNGIDCNGNVAIQASDMVVIIDSTMPEIVWNTELPESPQYVDPMLCTIALPILATVTDNCCIVAGNVSVNISVTNATLVDTVTVTQLGDAVVVAGIITVSNLNGCPAVLSVAIDATDCCGNDAVQLTDSVEIYDDTIPVINDLVVDDHVLVSADCCETTVNFTANVTDNCCIIPDSVAVTVTLPTANAILENIVVNRVQNGQGRVDITGSADVRCLTSCPARVEVHIEATDCCGNDAVPVTSTTSEGRVYDVTPPSAVDDPSGAGDTSAVLEPNMDVRLDDYGQYRLMVRQDTPVRIDVIANDTDNCSLCTCCGTMWINDIVAQPQYGTLEIETDHGDCNGGSIIRYAPNRGYVGPDRFTYRIVDACGNVSNVATVYLEVIQQTVMDDIYLTTCANTVVSFDVTATDLWVDPSNPGEIPFVFTIASLPVHGVILGDLADTSYAEHGRTTKQIESAMVKLTYVPAEGFIGRDTAGIRFADPFGGESTAAVDVLVSECNEAAERSIVLHHGDLLPIIVPATFAAAYEAGEKEWGIEGEDGGSHTEAISAKKDEHSSTYVLILDTGELTPGRYRATIGIGNGERVIFTVEVKG